MIFDALFRFQIKIDVALEKKQMMLESLYGNLISISEQHILSEFISIYHMTLIEMSDDFKTRFIKVYSKDPQ